jgi:hypothetical protein
MAEWQSFRDRERALGLFADEHPLGLIYPVRYADGANYHPDANQALCRKDFTKLNYPYESFRDSVKYLDFDELVQQVANDLVARLPDLPSWQPDFPVSEPLPMGPVGLARPVI